MTQMIRIEFHGQEIEATEKDGQIWIALKRLCENLGIRRADQAKKVKSNPAFENGWMDIHLPSPGGSQETFCVNLDVLPLWLGSISASRVKPEVRDILIRYQRECMTVLRDHFFGNPQPQPSSQTITPARQLLAQAHALVEHEDRISQLEQRLNAKEERERQTARELLALPEPKDLPQPRTIRSLLVERMRMVAETRGGQHRDFWNKLYREYYHRAGLDLKARARNRKHKPLDVATSLGVIGKLYDLCCHMWPSELSDMLSDTSNGVSQRDWSAR